MGKEIREYIDNIAEAEQGLSDIITVEHRSNNPNRDFLFVNKLQGKHIPARPSQVLNLFDTLTKIVESQVQANKIVVVGFAETATAIGNYLANHLTNCTYHLQTTREECKLSTKLLNFSEEHSHATEQYLYGSLSNIGEYDYILFVEDEISTGKTILNFIHEFNKINSDIRFGVASICNWQNKENKEKYRNLNIDTFSLISGSIHDISTKMDVCTLNFADAYLGKESNVVPKEYFNRTPDSIFYKERTGYRVSDNVYDSTISELNRLAINFLQNSKDALVIGTEEFMYVPIMLGSRLEQSGVNVYTHSTTRSSIDILADNRDAHNSIVDKSKLHSAYDSSRVTYIYNLEKHDKAIVVTDGNDVSKFINDITTELLRVGFNKQDILILRID